MFRIAHLSDLHLGPLPEIRNRDLLSKRLTGYINWRRNRARRSESHALGMLIADMQEQEPDHIAITGDLTNLALDEEIEGAAAWLETLGEPGSISVIPGNHDAYVPGAHYRYRRAWAPWMRSDDDDGSGVLAGFPFVRRRGPAVLIGVSTAVATAPFWATGRVGPHQTEALSRQLAAAGLQGLFRVVLIHHTPAVGPALRKFTRRLVDAGRVRAAIGGAGAELVLHGHDHVRSIAHIDGDRGHRIPVVGVPAGAGYHRPADPITDGRAAGYALHDIRRTGNRFRLTVVHRAFSPGGAIIEAGRYQAELPVAT